MGPWTPLRHRGGPLRVHREGRSPDLGIAMEGHRVRERSPTSVGPTTHPGHPLSPRRPTPETPGHEPHTGGSGTESGCPRPECTETGTRCVGAHTFGGTRLPVAGHPTPFVTRGTGGVVGVEGRRATAGPEVLCHDTLRRQKQRLGDGQKPPRTYLLRVVGHGDRGPRTGLGARLPDPVGGLVA